MSMGFYSPRRVNEVKWEICTHVVINIYLRTFGLHVRFFEFSDVLAKTADERKKIIYFVFTRFDK